MNERTFRRWCRRYKEDGEAGVAGPPAGQAIAEAGPAAEAAAIEKPYRERYVGFTAKHFTSTPVKNYGLRWGYTWTKSYLQERGYLKKAPRRGAHRRKRVRKPLPGMMLHQDGSQHCWIPGFEGALDLIVTLDDATGAIAAAITSARPRPAKRSTREH